MKVALTAEQEKFVLDEIQHGRAKSPEEVVGCGLEILRAHDEYIDQNRERLCRELDIGIQQANRGNLYDGEEVFKGLLTKLRKRKKRRP